MNLEELRVEWMAQSQQLRQQLKVNHAMLRQVQAANCNAALGRLTRRIWIALALNGIAAVLLGCFACEQLGEARFLAPAVVLAVFVLALLASAISQLVAIAETDFNAAILKSQRRLERLRIHRILETKWTLLLAPLLWLPLLIVALKGLFGVDVYAVFSARWLLANALFGVAAIPLLWWISRHLAGRFSSSGFVQRLMDDIAGRSLVETRAYVAQLAAAESLPRDEEA